VIQSATLNAAAGYFLADNASGATHGVFAANHSTTDGARAGTFAAGGGSGATQGVHGETWSTSNSAYAIYGDKASCTGTASYCYGVATDDKMLAARFDTGASDVAEYYATDQALQPGDVVMAAPTGGGRIVRSEGAYTTAVLGVISSGPGLALGSGEYEGGDGNVGKVPVALTGRVPCKVSAENGPIRPGDLLVTSATPGHAMRADEDKIRHGSVIGKALDSLESGMGTVQMLVTLQ
jgi:hypothetical protein